MRARFDLFDRINTGSKVANKAEVRRGALVGPFLDLVISLAKNPVFEELAPVSDAQNKLREREELVTRFFAYGDGLEGYQDRVSPFLFNYARRMNSQFTEHPNAIEDYRKRFLDTMAFVSRITPLGFRRTPRGKATPRARFEAIAIGSYLARREQPNLDSRILKAEWLTGREFRNVTGSDGANAIARLERRLHFVRDRLLQEFES